MTNSSPRDLRFWCAYAVMITPNAAVGLTLAAMPPILPELAARVGGEHNAQLITSVAGFGMIVGGMFSGRVLELVGIRAFTLASLIIYGLFGGLGWYLSTALSMGLSRFALGMGGVFFSTAALALTAATFTGAARSRVIGLQQATSQVVNVCAVFIVGALVQFTGWRGAFLLYVAFALVLLAATLIGVRPRNDFADTDFADTPNTAPSNPRTETSSATPSDPKLAGLSVAPAYSQTETSSAMSSDPQVGTLSASAEPVVPAGLPAPAASAARVAPAAPSRFLSTIAPVCALTTLMGILTVIPMAQLPFVLADNGQGSPRLVSIVLGANFVFAAISAMSFTRLGTLFGKRATFFGGLTCGMVGIALMGFVDGLFPACIAAALAGFGTGIYNTYVFDHGVEISPPVYHGRAAGLLFAFMFFGAAINPLVAAVFEQLLGLHHAFPAMAIVALLCGLPVILRRAALPAQSLNSAPGP